MKSSGRKRPVRMGCTAQPPWRKVWRMVRPSFNFFVINTLSIIVTTLNLNSPP
jgi:hypothetical protein